MLLLMQPTNPCWEAAVLMGQYTGQLVLYGREEKREIYNEEIIEQDEQLSFDG